MAGTGAAAAPGGTPTTSSGTLAPTGGGTLASYGMGEYCLLCCPLLGLIHHLLLLLTQANYARVVVLV